MIKKVIRKLFRIFGYKIFLQKITKKKQRVEAAGIIAQIDSNQLDSGLHLSLSKQLFLDENYLTAWAELKTAQFLGLAEEKFRNYEKKFKDSLPNLTELNHNVYFRTISLANVIKEQAIKNNTKLPSVLDAGGGDGVLASFIPDYNYCLVDPKTNGINGLSLPFDNESFDFVVSCHVLEHVPMDERKPFLDQLCNKAKKAVILLNPIHVEKTLPTERLQLMIDTTNTLWAKEHLECSLPRIDFMEDYANENNLHFEYRPNGSITTTIALALVEYLSKFWDEKNYKQIKHFYNTKYLEILDSKEYPNAGIFILSK